MLRYENLETPNTNVEAAINDVLFAFTEYSIKQLMDNAVKFQTANRPNYIAAVDCYSKILKVQPNNIEALNNRGICLVSQGRLDEAMLDFNRVLQLNPNCIAGLNNRGALYYSRGQLTEALDDFNRVLQNDPTNADAKFNISLLNKAVNQGCCVIL